MGTFELQLIDFNSKQLKRVLPILLCDRTTEQNIIWTTNAYSDEGFTEKDQITMDAFYGTCPVNLQPRARKSKEEQLYRTRAKAEVFTPSWICNQMNNYADTEWFGKANVFNTQHEDHTWTLNEEKIEFPKGKTWKDYVLDCRLEITCGEAPYLVSRYDTITSTYILPIVRRIGLLDRKLRVVNENTKAQKAWTEWAIKALQSCYGYEYQGDSLLIARINLFLTFLDYYTERWNKEPEYNVLSTIATIISWNLWQMDGFLDTVPFGRLKTPEDDQMDLFGFEEPKEPTTKPCVIRNWKDNRIIEFRELKRSEGYNMEKKKMFDFVIGNPPYQETTENTSDKPVYNYFMDASFLVGDKVELITPGRFLFRAGKTPVAWDEKMLNDPHFKVLEYEVDAKKIFPSGLIKGGIAITYYDYNRDFGKLGTFIVQKELRNIVEKTKPLMKGKSLDDLVFQQNRWNLTELYKDYPEAKQQIGSDGRERRLTTSIFASSKVFHDNKETENDLSIIGLIKNIRCYKYINAKYIDNEHENLFKYKVIVPASNGSGAIGEVLSTPLIGEPLIGYTQTFIGIGAFSTLKEATAALKYVKSKFARLLLGTLKITQHNHKGVWVNVPLQDFTDKSDIDWSKSIHEIDLQLYKKYGLDQHEIDFIETHVKEMV